MIEEWKDVEGYEGVYAVSNLGRIKSLPRRGRKSEKILSPSANTTGYLLVQLRKDNHRKSLLVHRLVMQAFSPISEYLEVNHKDFDIKNNKLTNLEWVTPEQNTTHYWTEANLEERLPTPKGENHHLTVVTVEIVKEVRRLWDTGEITNKSLLAKMFGIGEATVRQIVNRVTWKDV